MTEGGISWRTNLRLLHLTDEVMALCKQPYSKIDIGTRKNYIYANAKFKEMRLAKHDPIFYNMVGG